MTHAIELQVDGRTHELIEGLVVRRVLPFAKRRAVGPFVFLDHIGPAAFGAGRGIDIGPHPHIGLATVTYLFDGRIRHADSLGTVQHIAPGDVNWMTAGRGIVHSERTPREERATGSSLHGLQTWLALPQAAEDVDPAFVHHPRHSLPEMELGGARVRVVAGTFLGRRSPVTVYSETLYAHVRLPRGASFAVPAEHQERAVYIVDGRVEVEDTPVAVGGLAVLRGGVAARVSAGSDATIMLLGGEPLDGPRTIWWNFVSSSRRRIDDARAAWLADRLGRIEGEDDRILLPSR